jgi:tRNA nucleotidyltransferase (CCA-adding enzyme)
MNERVPTESNMDKNDIPSDPDALRDLLFAQDEKLLKAANALANKIKSIPIDPKFPNSEPRALLVGGFVRDAMLGLNPKDADLEVYGVSSNRLEQFLEQVFPGRVNAVGKSFGVYKVAISSQPVAHSPQPIARLELDISIPRRESKTGKGHKDFTVKGDPSMPIKEAARRRDFTMNALAADPLSGEIFDEFGGLDDLRSGTLRVTDPERFQDDALRVYRALQFAARMDLEADPKSLELMKEMVDRGDMDDLSKERVTEEMHKLLMKAERPSVGFELARELGIIEKYYPELNALIDLPQEKEWHPEGDAWTHTMLVLDEAAKIIRDEARELTNAEKRQIMLGSLCHDLGKATTTEEVDGRIKSYNHEMKGKEPAKAMLKKWTFSDTDVDAAVVITTEHLKPIQHERALKDGDLDERRFVNVVRKLLKRIDPTSWKVLIAGSEADVRGRTIPGARAEADATHELYERIILEHKLYEEPAKPLIQGRDLIKLGLVPGQSFGKIINEVEEARDAGALTTPEEALEFVKGRFLSE